MSSSKNRTSSALVIIGLLFFIFGFVTWLNGTLIPFLKLACQLHTDLQAFLVATAFYSPYLVMALPSGLILNKIGYKNGMALGLFIMAIGSILFIPAANALSFPYFLVAVFIQGTGLTILQTASNPYISILGPLKSAAKRMSIMGICNKVAGILSPIIVSGIILKNATALEQKVNITGDPIQKGVLLSELAHRVISPYIIMTVVLIILSVMIKLSSLPEINMDGESNEDSDAPPVKGRSSVFQYPHLLLGVLCIFVYVGVEVLAGDGIGTFGKSSGIPLDITKYFTSFTLGAMLLGYVLGILLIPRYLSQQLALRICAVSGIVFGICVFFTSGYIAITFIALLGLSNSLMWPAIWPLALEGLGKFTKIGSALLIMGIAGGAVFPPLYGALKASPQLNNTLAFCICILPCYAYILYYAVSGHKAGK